jgi:hypothetical protein
VRLTLVLSIINDVVQAAIVIFGVSVAFYNLPHSLKDRVTRAFNSLLYFVCIVYLAELIATRATSPTSVELWVRLEWIGIAMVPAAQFHLADALLVTTGDVSRRRRLLVRVWYLAGVAFFSAALFSGLVVEGLILVPHAPHLQPGPLFIVFGLYYWLISGASLLYVWRARQRCMTHTTRKRLTVILLAILAAPLAVFPYLLLRGDTTAPISNLFWLAIIAGNVLVSVMFAMLTYYIAYFGASTPDRVVRVRLFKFMARVPMAATIVLLVFILVGNASPMLGLPTETALAMSVVLTVILVEWIVHAFKRPLERVFQLTDEPEVRRIQELSERVFTTRDLRQFLDSVLAATCEVLRSPTAYVAAFTPDGPRLEAVVGPLVDPQEAWRDEDFQDMARSSSGNNSSTPELETSDGFVLWREFWIRTIHSRGGELRLGIMGIRARADRPDLSESEQLALDRLVDLAAEALEDRILQQDVFAAVERLLPQVTNLQIRRSEAAFGGAPYLIAPQPESVPVVEDPDFSNMVRDALSHFWGGPKLTESPLMRLKIVQRAAAELEGNPTRALRDILLNAIEQQRPEGERNMTTAEWILYNILELKFIQGQRVRDVARRLAMSESDLYRKQRVAIESVARAISSMEEAVITEDDQVVGAAYQQVE